MQTLLFDGPDEPLRVGVAVRRTRGRPHNPDAFALKECLDRPAPFRIAITDQCAARNVRHVVDRSRHGGMPSDFRMFAMVDRATRCPTFFSAPWMRV